MTYKWPIFVPFSHSYIIRYVTVYWKIVGIFGMMYLIRLIKLSLPTSNKQSWGYIFQSATQLRFSHTSATADPKVVYYFNFGVRNTHCVRKCEG